MSMYNYKNWGNLNFVKTTVATLSEPFIVQIFPRKTSRTNILYYACKAGNVECVTYLLNLYPHLINEKAFTIFKTIGKNYVSDGTALSISVRRNHVACVRLLLERGALLDKQIMIFSGRSVYDVQTLLLDHGACCDCICRDCRVHKLQFTRANPHEVEIRRLAKLRSDCRRAAICVAHIKSQQGKDVMRHISKHIWSMRMIDNNNSWLPIDDVFGLFLLSLFILVPLLLCLILG